VSFTLKLLLPTAVATQMYHSCNAELVRSPVSKYGHTPKKIGTA